MHASRWATALIMVAVAGCSPETPRSNPLARAHAEIFCRAVFACPVRNPVGATSALAFADEQDCIARYPEPVDPELVAAYEQGTLELDAEEVERCKAEITTTCPLDTFGLFPASCRRIVRGTVAEGEPCALSFECATGTCAIAEGATCGTCVPGTAPLDAPCTFDGQCAPSPDGNVACLVRETYQATCRLDTPIVLVPGGVGSPCGSPADANGNLDVCEPGLYCDANHLCQTPIAQGELCILGAEACELGTACVAPGGESRCRGLRVRSNAGESCGFDGSWIDVCDARAGLVCDADTTCHRLTDGASGSPCTTAEHCDDGTFCALGGASPEGVCEPLRANGATCELDFECRSSHCEIGANDQGTCGDPVAPMLCSAG